MITGESSMLLYNRSQGGEKGVLFVSIPIPHKIFQFPFLPKSFISNSGIGAGFNWSISAGIDHIHCIYQYKKDHYWI